MSIISTSSTVNIDTPESVSNVNMPSPFLKTLALRASIWIVGSHGLAQLIRFGSNLVLARLLFPEAFGLMALINICIIGIHFFSDLGLEASIIQNERSDNDFLYTAWTIQIIRGLVLFFATIIISYPFSIYYDEPMLRYLLPVAGLGILFDGFKSVSLSTANRKLYLGRLQILEISVQLISSTVMIVFALLTRSIWALVAGSVVSSFSNVVASHLFFPSIGLRLRLDKSSSRAILQFGIWLFISSIVTFLAQSGDRLIFGKLLPIGMLGVYSIALMISEVPTELISKLAFKVLFPSLSQIRRKGSSFVNAFSRSYRILRILTGFASIGLTMFGPWLVSYIYDERYTAASWIIRLFALGIWLKAIIHIQAATLLACGRTKFLAAANASRLIWLCVAVPLAFYHWNFQAAVLCVVLSDVPRYITAGIGIRFIGLYILKADILLTTLFGFSIGAGFLSLRFMHIPNAFKSAVVATLISCFLWLIVNVKTIFLELRNRT